MNFKVRTIDLSNLDTSDVDPADVIVGTLAGTGTKGTADSSDGTGATAEFQGPEDIGHTSGDTFYLSDVDYVTLPEAGAAIRRVNRVTGETTEMVSGTDTIAALSESSPFVYFADCVQNSIRRWQVGTNTLTTVVGGSGSGDQDGVGSAARLNCPQGVELNSIGTTLYFTDYFNFKIKSVDLATRTVKTIAGIGFGGSNGDALTAARFRYPTKLSLATRHLFVADMHNCAVRVLDLVTSSVATVHGGQNRCEGSGDGAVGGAGIAIGTPLTVLYSPNYGIFVGSGDWGYLAYYNDTRQAVQLIH